MSFFNTLYFLILSEFLYAAILLQKKKKTVLLLRISHRPGYFDPRQSRAVVALWSKDNECSGTWLEKALFAGEVKEMKRGRQK